MVVGHQESFILQVLEPSTLLASSCCSENTRPLADTFKSSYEAEDPARTPQKASREINSWCYCFWYQQNRHCHRPSSKRNLESNWPLLSSYSPPGLKYFVQQHRARSLSLELWGLAGGAPGCCAEATPRTRRAPAALSSRWAGASVSLWILRTLPSASKIQRAGPLVKDFPMTESSLAG